MTGITLYELLLFRDVQRLPGPPPISHVAGPPTKLLKLYHTFSFHKYHIFSFRFESLLFFIISEPYELPLLFQNYHSLFHHFFDNFIVFIFTYYIYSYILFLSFFSFFFLSFLFFFLFFGA